MLLGLWSYLKAQQTEEMLPQSLMRSLAAGCWSATVLTSSPCDCLHRCWLSSEQAGENEHNGSQSFLLLSPGSDILWCVPHVLFARTSHWFQPSLKGRQFKKGMSTFKNHLKSCHNPQGPTWLDSSLPSNLSSFCLYFCSLGHVTFTLFFKHIKCARLSGPLDLLCLLPGTVSLQISSPLVLSSPSGFCSTIFWGDFVITKYKTETLPLPYPQYSVPVIPTSPPLDVHRFYVIIFSFWEMLSSMGHMLYISYSLLHLWYLENCLACRRCLEIYQIIWLCIVL